MQIVVRIDVQLSSCALTILVSDRMKKLWTKHVITIHRVGVQEEMYLQRSVIAGQVWSYQLLERELECRQEWCGSYSLDAEPLWISY